jgi:adenylyltransferase/sulfurtransferase
MTLTPEQLERYQLQLDLPGMSEKTQDRLMSARVLILGISGSGAIAAQLLAGAGISTLGLYDDKKLGWSELHQQILASNNDIGKPLMLVAEQRLKTVFPYVNVRLHEQQLTAHNAEQIFEEYDLVVDGLEDWQAKLLASDTCMQLDTPLIHGGVTGYRLQVYAMVPGRSACLRCVFNQLGMDDLSRQQEMGSHAPAVNMTGALQASEAIQLISNVAVTGFDEMIQFDCLRREFYNVRELSPRLDCPDCGRQV